MVRVEGHFRQLDSTPIQRWKQLDGLYMSGASYARIEHQDSLLEALPYFLQTQRCKTVILFLLLLL
jgi:hypothetical protein